MTDKIIIWLVNRLFKTETGHAEMIRLRAQEMGAKRSEAKKRAAKERFAKQIKEAKNA